MKTITLLNQKGGVGKTTTAVNLGAALSLCGFKCLLIDLDPQGNLSQSTGFTRLYDTDITTYEVLEGSDINKGIKTKDSKDFSYDVLPVDIRLSSAEIELSRVDNRNYLLKNAIADLKKNYDFIFIDCPPSLNIFTLMALTASTDVIIPVQAQYLPLNGVAQIINTIDYIKHGNGEYEALNPDLEIAGVLLTFYDERRNLDREVLEAVDNAFQGKVFKTKISTNTKIAEAPSYGEDIMSYSKSSKGSKQYRQLAEELIANMKPQKRKAKDNGKNK